MRPRKPLQISALIPAAMLLIAAVSVTAAPVLHKLLPAKDEVKGFSPMASSLTYGKGVDVSKVYNGGYEQYTSRGVVDVARQMYQRDKEFIEVTVHTMKSRKAALDFVKYWAKERGGKLRTTKHYTGFVVTKPNVTGYYAMGSYFVTLSAYYPAAKSTKDVEAFAQAIRKKV